jgi:hypothetical protein
MIKPIQRKRHSKLAYWLWFLPLWLIFVPVVRFMEWRGSWPGNVFGDGMKKFFVWPEALQPGAQDIVVSSYFKSGTNWMLQITTQIAWRGKAEFGHIHDVVPWPELQPRMQAAVLYEDVDVAAVPTKLRVVKTHFAPGAGVPFNPAARYICVVRDPKSVFASSYPFIRNSSMGPLMPKPASWLAMYLSDDALFGPWPNFTAACWAVRDRANVLFLTYEQMKKDLPGTVAKVAQFMGVQLSDAELQAVIAQSEFAAMKKIEHKFDPVGMGPPWATPEGAMIRQGESKAKGEMLPGSHAQIDAWCAQRLQALQSDFPFAEHYGQGF